MQAKDAEPKPLTILELESSMNWGGQEERLLREMKWLEQHGHRAILACHRSSAIAQRATDAGLDFRHVPMRTNVDAAGMAHLFTLVLREKPDIVHAHSSKDSWFALLLHQAGIPVVRSRHITLSPRMPYGRKLIYRHGCRRLIASAGFIADNMRDVIGFAPDRVDVIGECVDADEFHPGDGSAFRREFGIAPEAPLFAVVGMLRGEKGQMFFAKAACEVLKKRPDVRFAIVGASTDTDDYELSIRKFLQAELSGWHDPPVIMTGFRRDIPAIMRAIDCLVVPSSKEAQTLVIPQAFATGKPAIGSNVGGIPELVRDGVNGLLFPLRDHEALAAAMLKLADDPVLARRFGQAGYELAQRELATDRKMGELVESYRRAIASR